jgi:hypothetical protein
MPLYCREYLKYLTPKNFAYFVAESFACIDNYKLKKKINKIVDYFENVESKHQIISEILSTPKKIQEIYFKDIFKDKKMADPLSIVLANSFRAAFENILKKIYFEIFDEDCNAVGLDRLVSSFQINWLLEHIYSKCSAIQCILDETDRIQKSYLFKGKEKVSLIKTALENTLKLICAKIFEDDCSVAQFEDLLLNTKSNGISVKEALGKDYTPAPIAALLKFFGEEQKPDPESLKDPIFKPR